MKLGLARILASAMRLSNEYSLSGYKKLWNSFRPYCDLSALANFMKTPRTHAKPDYGHFLNEYLFKGLWLTKSAAIVHKG